jgi:hypothetical protein
VGTSAFECSVTQPSADPLQTYFSSRPHPVRCSLQETQHGLDVHAETIAVAIAEGRDQVRSVGTIANRPEAIRRLLGKLGDLANLRVCYEAGPTG